MIIPIFLSKPRIYRQNDFMRYLRSALVASVLATSAFAQDVHFGVKVGIPMTKYFETGTLVLPGCSPAGHTAYSSATRRYTVGASVELHLKGGFAFEVDALYKRMGYVGDSFCQTIIQGHAAISTSTFDVKGNSWDFPIMAKYRFDQRLGPYVAGGFVLRYIGPIRTRGVTTVQSLIAGTTVTTPITESPELQDRTFPGLTVAAGIEFGLGRLRLLPEFRYTRWSANLAGSGLRFEPNQAEFLLGFLF